MVVLITNPAMLIATIVISSLVLIGLFLQVLQAVFVCKRIRNHQVVEIQDSDLPSCALILNVRGCDPGLDLTIQKLLDQNHPNYKLFVILDSDQDPAKQMVSKIVQEDQTGKIELRVIAEHSRSCALVANNHARALSDLSSEYEVIAWVDADADVWQSWLRELVTPLVNSDLSVVYGNRWYMPNNKTLGSLVRFVWNFGSLLQMVHFKYPWAGSLAMKSSFAKETDIVEVLGKSFTNDTVIFDVAQRAKKKIDFHPGMVIANRESIELKNFFGWMSRQLVYGRLYHPTWPLILGVGIATGLMIVVSIGLNLYNLFTMNWAPFAILVSALMVYWIVWVFLMFRLDAAVSKQFEARGDDANWRKGWDWLKIFHVAVIAQILFLAGLFKATFMKTAKWRGIEYELKGPFDIRMREYTPYKNASASPTNGSIL